MYRLIPIIFFAISCTQLDDDILPTMIGYVGSGGAIGHAEIKAHPIDATTGKVAYDRLLGSAVSREDGSFEIAISEYSDLIYLTAAGGETEAYWSDTQIPADKRGHTTAVVAYFRIADIDENGNRPVTMTPMTSLVYEHAKERLRLGIYENFVDALFESNRLLQTHFLGAPIDAIGCEADFACLRPRSEYELGRLDNRDMYTVTLLALDALARQIGRERGGDDPRRWNALLLSHDLRQDLVGNLVFDGLEKEYLNPSTLRSELVRALVTEYMGMKKEKSHFRLSLAHVRWDLERIASSTEHALFGPTRAEPIDLDQYLPSTIISSD